MMVLSYPIRLRPVILLLGDSLTQQGNDGMNGWASLLSNAYARRADVLNRGFSGYNSRHVCGILDHILLGEDTNNENDVLFCTVFLGANDAALPGERQHVPMDEYEANLGTIVTKLRSTYSMNVPILLLTPPPVDIQKWNRHRLQVQKDPSYRANDVAKSYGDRVKAVARQYNCSLVDVFALLGGNSNEQSYSQHLRDGLHLSTSGNELVYRGIMESVYGTPLDPSHLKVDHYTESAAVPLQRRPCNVLLGMSQFGFEENGWASLLASDYARRADVLHRGGYNTSEMLDELDKILHPTTVDGALFVTLWLGSNRNAEPLDEFERNLERILALLRARIAPPTTPQGECLDHLPILLITPSFKGESDMSMSSDDTNRRYAEIIHKVASSSCPGCHVLDFTATNNDESVWTNDGSPLNDELVHEGILQVLRKHYPQVTPMTDGNGRYGEIGIPLDEKLWFELC